MCEKLPAVSSGKSDCGRHCSRKEERAGHHGHRTAAILQLQHHFGSVRELAHDVVEQMRRHRGRALLVDLGGGCPRSLSMSRSVAFISRLAPAAVRSTFERIGIGIAALDHAVHRGSADLRRLERSNVTRMAKIVSLDRTEDCRRGRARADGQGDSKSPRKAKPAKGLKASLGKLFWG